MALDISKIKIINDGFYRDELRGVYKYSMLASDNPGTKTGAKIEVMKEIYGANRLPKGVEATKETIEKPGIYDWMYHAEFDAYHKITREGISLEGATMVIPWFPCKHCAWLIADSGIVRIVSHLEMLILGNGDDYGFEIAQKMLLKNGIELLAYQGKIGDCEHLFRGKLWNP